MIVKRQQYRELAMPEGDLLVKEKLLLPLLNSSNRRRCERRDSVILGNLENRLSWNPQTQVQKQHATGSNIYATITNQVLRSSESRREATGTRLMCRWKVQPYHGLIAGLHRVQRCARYCSSSGISQSSYGSGVWGSVIKSAGFHNACFCRVGKSLI